MKKKLLLETALLLSMLLIASCRILKPETKPPTDWTKQILKTYQGVILSSGATVPVSTTFKICPAGLLIGEYSVSEANMIVDGDLKDCREVGTREIECKWKDSYGEGILKITFTQDYSRFEGHWNFDEKQEEYPWNGVRK